MWMRQASRCASERIRKKIHKNPIQVELGQFLNSLEHIILSRSIRICFESILWDSCVSSPPPQNLCTSTKLFENENHYFCSALRFFVFSVSQLVVFSGMHPIEQMLCISNVFITPNRLINLQSVNVYGYCQSILKRLAFTKRIMIMVLSHVCIDNIQFGK